MTRTQRIFRDLVRYALTFNVPIEIDCDPDEWPACKELEKKGKLKVGRRGSRGYFVVEIINLEKYDL